MRVLAATALILAAIVGVLAMFSAWAMFCLEITDGSLWGLVLCIGPFLLAFSWLIALSALAEYDEDCE